MTQPTAPPAYDPAIVAAVHALADTIAVRHLPTPQYIDLRRHRMPTDQFEAAAAEHDAEISTLRNGIRTFEIEFRLGAVEVRIDCFEQ